MRKLFLSVGCALILLATATASDAKIFVKISDGTVAGTVDGLLLPVQGTPPVGIKGGLRLSIPSPAPAGTTDATVTFTLLSCTTRPCTVFFPSGASSQVTTGPVLDTFSISDVSSTSLARVEKFDSGASADRVSLKGIKITSLTSGKILTFTYGTQAGDLRSLTSTSTSYTGTVALTGSFKTSSLLRATACNAGLTATQVADPCVRLSLALNGTTVNGAGGTAVATVAVPCSNNTTGSPSPASVNPCGVNATLAWATGQFNGINDSKSISCPNTCWPTQVGTLVAEFNGIGDVLQLTASANGGMASDEAGGLEETLLALGEDVILDRWVAYTAALEKCKAVPKAPTTNDTRNVTNKSSLPISFEYWCGFFKPLSTFPAEVGVDLVSIVDEAEDEKGLTGSTKTRNDASRVAFLPVQGQLQLKDITVLSLTYDVVTVNAPSGNNTLGNLDFTDCTAGSFRVEIELLNNQGMPAGTAKVYLGSNGSNGDSEFKSGCVDFDGNIGSNTDARVDTSGLAGNLGSSTPITFQQLKSGNTGNLRVRKMTVIVDQGDATTAANHKVIFFDGQVNDSPAARDSLQVVTGLTRATDLSTNGVSIVVTKLTGTVPPPGVVPGVVKVIRNTASNPTAIQIIGGKFSSSVKLSEIEPESGQEYTISLCPNGVEETDQLQAPPQPPLPLDPKTPIGICIPDQAFMRLQ